MKAFDDILQMIADAKGSYDSYSPAAFEELCNLGRKVIQEAYDSKETRNRKFNQHDAYAFAIYYDGKEIHREYLEPEMSKGEIYGAETGEETGRKAVNKFIDAYTAPVGKKLTLLVVNGLSYSRQQEEGYNPRGAMDRYRILSQTLDSLDEAAELFKGNVELINL